MGHATSFFRTPLLAAIALPFFIAVIPSHPGFVVPPEEGSPAYLAIQHAHDAFATEFTIDLSDTEQALSNVEQVNRIGAPSYF